MKKQLILFMIFSLLFISVSSAEVFENITFDMPQHHYKTGEQSFKGISYLMLNSKVKEENNINLTISPIGKDMGYIELTDSLVKELVAGLGEGLVDEKKTYSNEELIELGKLPPLSEAYSLGLTIKEYEDELEAYKQSFAIDSYEVVTFGSNNYEAIKMIIVSKIFNIDIIQKQYAIPNGNNFYFVTFTGDYSEGEINSFLNSIKIDGFVSKNSNSTQKTQMVNKNQSTGNDISLEKAAMKGLLEAFFEGIIVAIVFVIIGAISKLFGKNRKNELTDEVDINVLSEEIEKEKIVEDILQTDKQIDNLTQKLEEAKKDLGNLTVKDAENLYNQKLISEEQLEEMIKSIENLQDVISTTSKELTSLQRTKNELKEKSQKF